jgi:hypothetical protein
VQTNLTKSRPAEFIAALKEAGGSSGNRSLRQTLDWDEDLYWRVQGQLIEDGKISAGRGKGGSVRLSEAQVVASASTSTALPRRREATPEIARERDLYVPLTLAIQEKWINKFGFDEVHTAETHSRGSKDTGGTFTRPDITTAGIRRYLYLPKRLEIVTFEVKTAEYINIMGVLEAVAHCEASHRSYVIYATSRAVFDAAIEAERITELSQKYGIGLLLVEHASEVESWDIVLEAIRHEPDPARLDRFLADLPSASMREKLSKWKE